MVTMMGIHSGAGRHLVHARHTVPTPLNIDGNWPLRGKPPD
jgi:hypothetical protein